MAKPWWKHDFRLENRCLQLVSFDTIAQLFPSIKQLVVSKPTTYLKVSRRAPNINVYKPVIKAMHIDARIFCFCWVVWVARSNRTDAQLQSQSAQVSRGRVVVCVRTVLRKFVNWSNGQAYNCKQVWPGSIWPRSIYEYQESDNNWTNWKLHGPHANLKEADLWFLTFSLVPIILAKTSGSYILRS